MCIKIDLLIKIPFTSAVVLEQKSFAVLPLALPVLLFCVVLHLVGLCDEGFCNHDCCVSQMQETSDDSCCIHAGVPMRTVGVAHRTCSSTCTPHPFSDWY